MRIENLTVLQAMFEKYHLRSIAFVIAIVSFNSIAAENLTLSTNEKSTVIIENVVYGPDEQEVMDICQPKSPTNASPVLLLIHGGGWTSGDKSTYMPLCKFYAKKGLAVISINYRLFNIKTLSNQWPAQISDAQLAVRWARTHANEYSFNTNKICAYGDSSGGHLALLLGLLSSKWKSDRDEIYPNESSSVTCVVDNFGPTDLKNSSQPILKTAQALVPNEIDKTGESYLDITSPLFHVHPLGAPTMIVQGSNDELVPKSQSISLRDAMLKSGMKVNYLEYVGGHQYKGLTPQEALTVSEAQVEFILKMLVKN